MPRIAGVDIPHDKPIWVSLCYIYGVGPHNSRVILKEAGIDPTRRAKEMTEDELAKIIGLIDKGFLVEGDCVGRFSRTSPGFGTSKAIAEIGTGEVCRRTGQRTRSNARTRKGPRKTVAGKKGVKELGK